MKTYNNLANKYYGLQKVGLDNRDLKSPIKRINFDLPNGLTYFKHFKDRNPTSDFSIGSRKGTPTVTRSATAPSSEIDSSGKINTNLISNYLRYYNGIYNSSGFCIVDSNGHSVRGIAVERAATNLQLYSDGTNYAGGLWTGASIVDIGTAPAGTVVKTNISIPELTTISGAKSQRIQYTGLPADVGADVFISLANTTTGSIVPNDWVTVSIFIRSQTATIPIVLNVRERDSSAVGGTSHVSSPITPTTSWACYAYTFQTVDADCSKVSFRIGSGAVDDGENIDFELYAPQVEKGLQRATSWIPTTTEALTRGAETLTYLNAGSSTAEAETIMMKVVPLSDFAVDNFSRNFYNTDTKIRTIYKAGTRTLPQFVPNFTDSSVCSALGTSAWTANKSYVLTGIAYGSTADINAGIAVNGIVETTDTDNYTTNAWGTKFWIGSNSSGSNQGDLLIQAIAKWDRPLTNAEILDASNKLMNL